MQRLYTHETHPNLDPSQTYLLGTIQATLAELKLVFGNPIHTPGERITTTWHLLIDGQIATIYDYGAYVQPAAEEVLTWRIGAMDERTPPLVHGYFRETLRMQREQGRAA